MKTSLKIIVLLILGFLLFATTVIYEVEVKDSSIEREVNNV